MTDPLLAQQSLPRHIQITELLQREIAAGRWQHGERLPPESTLAARLGVAVGTLRKSLAELAARGVLQRRQGSGTYVQQREGQRSVYAFFRLERLDGAGLPGAQLLDLQRCLRAPAGAAESTGATAVPLPALGGAAVDQPQALWRLRRLRLLDQLPVAVEEIWFDGRQLPALDAATLHESLYHFYETRLSLWIDRVEDHVSVAAVPAWAPAAFSPPPGTAVGAVARSAWDQHGRLHEVSHTWFDPTRARYTARWR
jgi:GntR family transcriptional regulator